jgi:hypothetical protein
MIAKLFGGCWIFEMVGWMAFIRPIRPCAFSDENDNEKLTLLLRGYTIKVRHHDTLPVSTSPTYGRNLL